MKGKGFSAFSFAKGVDAMALEHEKSGTTKFLDLFRYLLIFIATGFAVFLIWKQNRALALIEAIPILVVMFNLFVFLTLPAYSRTPEIFELMSKALVPFLHKHIFVIFDAFSLRDYRNSSFRPPIPDGDISEKDDAAVEAAANVQIENLSMKDTQYPAITDILGEHPAHPEKKLLVQQMSQLVFLATKALYSEQFSDMGTFVKSLPGEKNDINFLCAYIAIRIAAQLTKPPDDTEIADAIEQIQIIEGSSSRSDSRKILNLHKELAEIQWQRRQVEILRGKLAHQKDKYSYDGAIYRLQLNRKGPMPTEESVKLEELTNEIADLDLQIREHEMEALRSSDSEVYQGMKEHLEIQALQEELKTHKELEYVSELNGLTEIFDKKLKFLIQPESSET